MMMRDKIKAFLKKPTFPSEEQNIIANLLNISIYVLIIGTILGMITTLTFGYFKLSLALSFGFVGVSGSFFLLKKLYLKLACWTLLMSFIITLLLFILIGDGSHDIVILLFPLTIMVAGLLLDKRSLILFTVIVILSMQGIILGEIFGIIENKMTEYTLFSDIVSVFVIFLMSAITAYLLSNNIRSSIHQSMSNERALKESNRILKGEIEERKRISESLSLSEKKYRTLAETMTDAIITVDLDGKFTYLNPTFERVTGHRVQDTIGRHFTEIIAPEFVEPTRKNFNEGISGKKTPLYQVELISKDGRRLPIELNMTTLLSANGEPIGRIGIARDITDRINAENMLRQSEERYQSIVENSFAGIVIIANSQRIEYANNEFCKIIGYPNEEIIGRDFRTFLTDKTEGILEEYYLQKQNGRKGLYRYKCEIEQKNGSKRSVEISTSNILNSDKNRLTVGQILDITDKTEADEKMEIERNRAEFYLDLLSHDIANIHQGIYTTIQMADMKKKDDNYVDLLIETLRSLSLRSINLLKNVKILSNIEKRDPDIESINLKTMMNSVIDDIKDLFQKDDVVINLTSPTEDVHVEAGPLVTNLFFNLLQNGVKFQNGQEKIIDVEISPDKDRGNVEVSIIDQGPGIPDDMKELIFQRHTQGGDIRFSGIGLSLVKELVDQYKGTIKIEDRIKGDHNSGAVFKVTLPLAR